MKMTVGDLMDKIKDIENLEREIREQSPNQDYNREGSERLVASWRSDLICGESEDV